MWQLAWQDKSVGFLEAPTAHYLKAPWAQLFADAPLGNWAWPSICTPALWVGYHKQPQPHQPCHLLVTLGVLCRDLFQDTSNTRVGHATVSQAESIRRQPANHTCQHPERQQPQTDSINCVNWGNIQPRGKEAASTPCTVCIVRPSLGSIQGP